MHPATRKFTYYASRITLSLFILPALLSLSTAQAQSIYQDAMTLSEAFLPAQETVLDDYDPNRSDSFIDYLQRYVPPDQGLDTPRKIRQHYIDHNPFIGPLVEPGGATSLREAITGGRSILALPGLNVTTVADGLAAFLVERAKTELSISFFQRFKKALETQEDLRSLFPQTTRVLRTIDTEIYQVDAFIGSMRSAFRADLGGVLIHLPRLLSSEKYGPLFRNPTLRILTLEAFPAAQQLINGNHPAVALDRLAQANFDVQDPAQQNIQSGLQFTNLLSQSLLVDDAWVDTGDLRRLFTDNRGRTLQIYLGLLYEAGRDLTFVRKTIGAIGPAGRPFVEDTVSFHTFLEDVGAEGIKAYLYDLVAAAQQVEAALIDLKRILRDTDQAAGFDDYFQLTQSVLNLLREGYDLRARYLGAGADDGEPDLFLRVLDVVASLGLSVQQKNYTSIVVDVASLLDDVIKPQALAPYRTALLRYGSLMAGIAQAETAEEVQRAIEAVVLPPGSAALKKRSRFNVALSAYAGGFAGQEILDNPSGDNAKTTVGITLPVGFATSIGPCRTDCGAVTVFVSLLDVGAFGAFRLNDDRAELLPEVQLKNIIAPGLYLVYDWPGVPLSLGGGIQRGPNVRRFETTLNDINTIEAAGYRWSVFLSVDIPLFNLHTKL